MGDRSAIEWTDATWNPTVGCTRVSEGCRNCYAERMAIRLQAQGHDAYEGVVESGNGGPRWSGRVNLVPERLDQPLRWTDSRMVFVDSMSDLFHPEVSFEFIAAIFGTMAASPQHVFQVLTKRPARMAEWCEWISAHGEPQQAVARHLEETQPSLRFEAADHWPLANVWLGTSCEDQDSADARIPDLLRCPASVRFISAEPLLGPIDLSGYLSGSGLDWVIAGGESGPGARPVKLEWIRGIRDACVAAGTAFFFKQWGGRTPKANGRTLDEREWDEMPVHGERV